MTKQNEVAVRHRAATSDKSMSLTMNNIDASSENALLTKTFTTIIYKKKKKFCICGLMSYNTLDGVHCVLDITGEIRLSVYNIRKITFISRSFVSR